MLGIKGKSNGSRRYPGETNRNRPDLAATRREEAKTRQEQTDALSPQQRIERLDTKFGVGKGAQKERARLQALLGRPAKQATKAIVNETDNASLPPEVIAEIDAMNEESSVGKKKLKAKDRRSRNQQVSQ